MTEKIDFVVTWLDSSDPQWQKEYNKYKGITQEGDQSSARFRDWDLFKFWFRAVENYAPWVNKVFLVTNGTFPKWINPNHPKLVLVKHSDYIPAKFLPTFNSCTIELHMNKIKGLSEHFVYFNDDCYINAPITPEFYFRDGLPCDCNKESVFNVPKYNPVGKFYIYMSMLANIGVINRHFNRRKTIRESFRRWHGLHLGAAGIITSLFISLPRANQCFVGFNWKHTEQPFLKSVLDECWEKEPEMLQQSCTRFREEVILNPYFFRYWQFASNRFYPAGLSHNCKLRTIGEDIPLIQTALENPKIKSLCVNDTPICTDEDFENNKHIIQQAFERKFPQKSMFET